MVRKIVEWKYWWLHVLQEEKKGIGVVEVILILVVLIGLVVIFKSELTTIVNDIFSRISSESSGI